MLRTLAVALPFLLAGRRPDETALDRYVRKPDPTYAWKVVREVSADGATQFVVDLKSQTWRAEKEAAPAVWQHWLTVVRPDTPGSSTALLFIGGGGNGGEPPRGADERLAQLSAATRSVVAELKMVPNQPLVFNGDGKGRKEDDLIAYTWDQFLKTGDDTWPARLPMVKSAVRAMDCVQELLAGEQGGKVKVEKFVVAGGSKRGWTTWCAAAVDRRVAAIIPMVIDVLNVDASMRHHVAVYGFYSAAVGDYFRHGVMQRVDEPRLKDLYRIEDPYSYRERLTVPKYIVNASGDQFFCPDSSRFYFDDLPGEKHLRYVPNADHSLRQSDAWEGLLAFYEAILAGTARPKYAWTFEKDGSIRVRCETPPKRVTLWQATNPKARDFRLPVIGRAYSATALEDQGGGVFTGAVEPPREGWTAFFVELAYDTGFKVSTGVRVVPDTVPHPGVDPAKAPLESWPPRK
jgi:PhoPQ-activated pathogenicity-related protein